VRDHGVYKAVLAQVHVKDAGKYNALRTITVLALSKFKYTARFFIPETWNSLQQPCNLTNHIKLSTLKTKEKSYLLQNQCRDE